MRWTFGIWLLLAGCGDGGDDPGPPAAPPAPATHAKLCNFIGGPDDQPVTVTVEIGDPPVRFSAATGACSAAVDQACPTLPTGLLPVRAFQGSRLLGTLMSEFVADREYVLGTRLIDDGRLLLTRAVLSDVRCDSVDPAILISTGHL
jgi:hypothetical protein